jgi:hypothetical protein
MGRTFLLRMHGADFWKRFHPCLHFLGFVVTDLLEQPQAFCSMLARLSDVLLMIQEETVREHFTTKEQLVLAFADEVM